MRLSHPWAAIALNRAMAPPILVKTLLVARVSLDPPTASKRSRSATSEQFPVAFTMKGTQRSKSCAASSPRTGPLLSDVEVAQAQKLAVE